MKLNLRTMSLGQLDQVMRQLEQRKGQLHKQRAKDVRDQIDGLLEKAGLTLADVYPRLAGNRGGRRARAAAAEAPAKKGTRRRRGAKARGRKSINPPKYRNPANPAQTWTGHGKRPNWFIDAQKRGKENELLIRRSA